MAEARELSSAIAAPQRDGTATEFQLRARGQGLAAAASVAAQYPRAERRDLTIRLDELYDSGALSGADPDWQFSVGKKVLSWDVGYAWRPNDVVGREDRGVLLAPPQEGRPLLAAERFGADTAWTWVLVNPQSLHASFARRADAGEAALAMRTYLRAGAVDWHGFARWGEHTHASIGVATAWIVDEAVELHASLRIAQRHDGWVAAASAPDALEHADSWRQRTLGQAPQGLVGVTWTTAGQWSLIAEAFHDGSAPSDEQWRAWSSRNAALAVAATRVPVPSRPAYAADLAWQSALWNNQNLRRDNLFARLSWTHEAWSPEIEALSTPADGGYELTAALAWQGDRWRIEGGGRIYGGSRGAAFAQLPSRRVGYTVATWTF